MLEAAVKPLYDGRSDLGDIGTVEPYEVGLLLAFQNDLQAIVAGVKANLATYQMGVGDGAVPTLRLTEAGGPSTIVATHGGPGPSTVTQGAVRDDGSPTAQLLVPAEREAGEVARQSGVGKAVSGEAELLRKPGGEGSSPSRHRRALAVAYDDEKSVSGSAVKQGRSLPAPVDEALKLPSIPGSIRTVPRVRLASRSPPMDGLARVATVAVNERALSRVADATELARFSAPQSELSNERGAASATGRSELSDLSPHTPELVAAAHSADRASGAPREIPRSEKATSSDHMSNAMSSEYVRKDPNHSVTAGRFSGGVYRHGAAQAGNSSEAGGQATDQLRGDVYLDGALMGRWISRLLNRESERASSGPTGFDARRGRLLPGSTVA